MEVAYDDIAILESMSPRFPIPLEGKVPPHVGNYSTAPHSTHHRPFYTVKAGFQAFISPPP